ncbi:MAG: hypothetical protein IKP12_00795 [Acholeplasmatales bacterium]|nr:hypothetical protein [Acholeplasmatales bacterium]
MSLFITQLALNSDSKKFFNSLLLSDSEKGGEVFDINVSPVHKILEPNQNLVFNSKAELINSFYYSYEKKAMILGYIKKGIVTYLTKEIDKPEEIRLSEDDLIIYIKY